MLHGSLHTSLVVHAHHAGAERGYGRVHEDHGNVPAGQAAYQVILHLRGHDGDAVHLALQHARDAGFHALGIVVGVGDEHFLVVLHRDVFEGFD